MIKRTIILADGDEVYLERLSNYFMEKAPQLDLLLFTDKTLLLQYLSGSQADILVVGENFADSQISGAAAGVKLVLSGSMTPVEGFELVRKYQKTEGLLNEILLKYAEATGSSEAIKGSSHTKTAAFYSPAGGTGKTVLALGMAAAAVKMGYRTLYLNLEEIDSVREVLGGTPGSLSDIFLALKTKGMNVGIKLASCVGQEPSAGFFYLSGVESISEYGEMKEEDLARLIDIIRGQSEYDVVVLDLSSGFSKKTVKILEQADVIFAPIVCEESAVSKMSRLLREGDLHEDYSHLFEKMSMIINRAGADSAGLLQQHGILNRIRCEAWIGTAGIFSSKQILLRSGDSLPGLYQPLFKRLMEG